MLKTRVLRCRINEVFTSDMLKAIHKVTDDPTIPDNNSKIDIINELLTRFGIDYVPIGPGTNRYAILIDGIVFKIALDDWGMRDNLNEFAMSSELQPYVIKVYEVNSLGTIMTCQYVTVIDKEEYLKQKEAILSILEDLSQSYLLGDVGYVSKNFLNWGYTDEGELVILDFAYIYKVISHELLCNNKDCISHPYLEYNSTYTDLYCPDCRKKYTFMDIRRRYNKKDEEDLIRLTKELSYSTQGKTYDIEVDVNEEKKPFEIAIDEDDDENAFSNLTYEELNSKELYDVDIGVEKSMEIISSFVVQKDENIFDPDVLVKLEERRKNKEDINMSYFMERLAELQSGKKEKKDEYQSRFTEIMGNQPFKEESKDNEEQEDYVDAYMSMLNSFHAQQPQKKQQANDKKNENNQKNNSNYQNKKKFNTQPAKNHKTEPAQNVKQEEKVVPKRVIPTRNPNEDVEINVEEAEREAEDFSEVTATTQYDSEEQFNDIINELQEEEAPYSNDEENPLDESKEVKGGENVTEEQKKLFEVIYSPQQTVMEKEETKAVIKNEGSKTSFSFTPAPSKESDIEALINSQKGK